MHSSILFWRCRGARKRRASLYLKEVVKKHRVFFIGLLETKISYFDRKDVDHLIGSEWDFVQVPSEGLSGGILVLWKSNITGFQLLKASSHLIIGDLEVQNKGKWRIATIYGNKNVYRRRSLWESLGNYSSKEFNMVIGGDFNYILSKEDKRGGKRFKFPLGPKEMKNFLSNYDFHEIGYVGQKFTWCNNQNGVDRILERLDRCLLNSVALNTPNQFVVRNLARVASDHCPILLNLMKHHASKKVLRFEDIWASNKASVAVVKGI
ncbi:hypothetical protein KFK09_001794 [Dendrobium nobile]|uniref:Endonuclease/exonuclease/phosphatase domain-containing protein n=1 Tax=Dendrobium nobile TaxID=94219 RepID=A0A8T3C8D5_DENNO|nr:hypothetical protein KFK09_001794 [Dendrobium nobile]